MNEPKTVRVRIAVAVNQHGYYSADGGRGAGDAKLKQNVREFVKGFAAFHWIEADVPLPLAPQTIHGEATATAEDR
jgi:hypothetical protein